MIPLPRLAALLSILLLPLAPACVDQRCTRHSECAVGLVCVAATGTCATPECTSDGTCGPGRVCDEHVCVAGCRVDAECPADRRCFSDRCVPRAEACDCAGAPRVCATNLNPLSAGAGDSLCLPDGLPAGGVLLFGSVLCSHCQALLGALEALQAEVAPAGDASLIFVQQADLQVGGQVIAEGLAGATVPVLQDGPEVGIWNAYNADWYHVVLLDRSGCLARHWGPLQASDVSGRLHAELTSAWREARIAPCTPPSPETVEPAPDALEVSDGSSGGAPDSAPDGPAEAVPAESEASAVADVEPSAEIVGETVAETVDEVWREPFPLQEVCQVEAGLPTPLGGLVPHFLCQDRNPASVTANGPVSDVILRELVWIAYFGTCT